MKWLIPLLILSSYCPCLAQDSTKATPEHRSFIQELRIGFPEAHTGYYAQLKSNKVAELPYGLNELFYKRQSGSGTFFPIGSNYSFRLLSLYYRNVGVALYYAGYGADVDINAARFSEYLSSRFPGHYIPGDFQNKFYTFEGWRLGLSYQFHYRRFIIIEPGVTMGFERAHAYNSTVGSWVLKEMGSNQFINYAIDAYAGDAQRSYQAQLHLGWRFNLKDKRFTGEAGLTGGYLYAPYHIDFRIEEQPYGRPATVQKLRVEDTYRQMSFGVYTVFYWKRKPH